MGQGLSQAVLCPGSRSGALALAMGVDDWATLHEHLQAHRDRVSSHFRRAVFAPGATVADADAGAGLEQLLDPEPDVERRRECLATLQAPELVEPILRQLEQLRESGYYRRLDETGRRRLQILLPRLLRAVVRLPNAESASAYSHSAAERIWEDWSKSESYPDRAAVLDLLRAYVYPPDW